MTATLFKLPRSAPSRLECEACSATAACDCGVPYVRNAAQKREAVAKILKADPKKSDRQVAKMTGVSHHTVATVRSDLEANGQIAHKDDREEEGGRKARGRKPRTEPHKAKAAPQAVVRDRINEMARVPTEFTQQYIERLDAWLDGEPELVEDAVVALSNALHLCAEEYERMAKFVKAKFPAKERG